jgi:uncharacterized protein (DUF488 family)
LEARARSGEALAIMCAETLWWRCHRRLIADALVLDGIEVRHLVDRPPGSLHRPSSPGRATAMAPERDDHQIATGPPDPRSENS